MLQVQECGLAIPWKEPEQMSRNCVQRRVLLDILSLSWRVGVGVDGAIE